MNRLLGLSLFIGFLLCHFASVADAQEKLRIIDEAAQENSPVVVVSRHVGDKAFDRSHRNMHGSTAGHNWLSSLSFDVKNVSHKNVTYINLRLDIPKSGKMEHNGMMVPFVFGNRVASAATANRDSSSPLELLKPGDVVKLKMSDLQRTQMEKYLKKYDAEDIEQIRIDIREVHFDDGTGWSLGIELRQDPLNPNNMALCNSGSNEKPHVLVNLDVRFCSHTLIQFSRRLHVVFNSGPLPEFFCCGGGNSTNIPNVRLLGRSSNTHTMSGRLRRPG